MKITTPLAKNSKAKILIVGTPVQFQKWVSKWGSKLSEVEFIYVSKPEHFKSRHKKNTRVMVISDPKNLQEKVGDKIKRLNPIHREGFEAQITASEKQEDKRDNAIAWFRETSMGEKVEPLNELS